MLFCLCTKFLYSEEPECDAGKSGNNDFLYRFGYFRYFAQSLFINTINYV